MKEFYVKIISASDPHFWYAKYVGDLFLIDREDEYFWTREPAGYRNFILKEDAEVVKENTSGSESANGTKH